jgi:hypothetical protein
VTIVITIYTAYVNSVACVREQNIPTERPLLFADRGCRVFSVTDLYGHILGFLDQILCM